jgi:hypothetical protein
MVDSQNTKVDTTKLFVREVDRKLARDMIIENHYSHKWTKCSVALGLYYSDGTKHKFFNEAIEKLIGCACYGDPIGRHSGASISTEISRKNVYELVRLFIHDGYGDNIESYLIGKGFKWLKKNRPNIKALISYADPEQGHVGTIYQATNWIYQGNRIRPNDILLFKWEEEGKWQHQRTIWPYYGTNNIEKLRNLVPNDFWVKNQLRKHRYVYLLGSKSENKKALSRLKHPIYPYPKTTDIENIEIKKIIVTKELN